MDVVRRRVAVGIFETVEDVVLVLRRLGTTGVRHHEYVVLPADRVPQDLALHGPFPDAIELADTPVLVMGQVVLCIHLATQAVEAAIATVLLESAARSVQFHDLGPAPAAYRR